MVPDLPDRARDEKPHDPRDLGLPADEVDATDDALSAADVMPAPPDEFASPPPDLSPAGPPPPQPVAEQGDAATMAVDGLTSSLDTDATWRPITVPVRGPDGVLRFEPGSIDLEALRARVSAARQPAAPPSWDAGLSDEIMLPPPFLRQFVHPDADSFLPPPGGGPSPAASIAIEVQVCTTAECIERSAEKAIHRAAGFSRAETERVADELRSFKDELLDAAEQRRILWNRARP